VITDEGKIIAKVHDFYSKLYTTDSGFKERQPEALKTIFEHLTRMLTNTQIQSIENLPDKYEIHKTLKIVANNKALGINRITAEILKECWSFIADNFFALIKHYWET
jgi:hypothetical protein